MPRILISGAGGMIGKNLTKHFTNMGYEVRTLVRDKNKADGSKSFYWNYLNEEIDIKAFEGVDFIFNLSGANVSKRWTFNYKKEIYDSRIMSTNFLFKTIKNKNIKIKKIISVSGTGFYGDTHEKNLNETSSTGNDFLAMVCRDWENSTKQFSTIKVPVCIFRVGVVISPQGGFAKKVGTPIKLFAGVHLGSGTQVMSWIGLKDLCRMFEHAIEKNLVGTYNAAATTPLTVSEIDNAIAKFYHRKIWLPNIPEWALKLTLGEMSVMLFSSCHTSNAKIKATGFVFSQEEIAIAMRE